MENKELMAGHRLDQQRRGLMPSSIARRQEALEVVARLGPLLDLTHDEIERFLDLRRIGPQTRSLWIVHLHEFYKWAIREGLTAVDPTARIVRPKVRRGQPRPADTDELHAALEYAGPEEEAWILLAAYQGLRCQEIAGLRREDVMDNQGRLRVVQGKGGKERTVPLHPDVLAALRALPMPRKGYVFTRPRGGPYTGATLSRRFNAYLRDSGVNATAHQLRHWFGTAFYAQTKDLRMTGDMMGHSDMATTAVYTKVDTTAAGDAIRGISFLSPDAEKGKAGETTKPPAEAGG